MKLYLRILSLILIFTGLVSCNLELKDDPKPEPEPTIENPQIKITGTTSPNQHLDGAYTIAVERDFTTNLDSGNYVLTMSYKLTKGSSVNNTLWLSFFDSQWKTQQYGLTLEADGLTNTISIDLNDLDYPGIFENGLNRADQRVLQLLFSVAETNPIDFELFIESIEIKDGENIALSSNTADGWRSETGTITTVEKQKDTPKPAPEPEPEPVFVNPQIKLTGTTVENPHAQDMYGITFEKEFTQDLSSNDYVLTFNYKAVKGGTTSTQLNVAFYDSDGKALQFAHDLVIGEERQISIAIPNDPNVTVSQADLAKLTTLQFYIQVKEATPIATDVEFYFDSIEIKNSTETILSSSLSKDWKSGDGTLATVEKQ